VGDEEDVPVVLHLAVELLHAGELGKSDLRGRMVLGEGTAETVVAGVEGVGGEKVGDGDGGVEFLATELEHDVLGDA
jgi:hypothetical protein